MQIYSMQCKYRMNNMQKMNKENRKNACELFYV